MAEFSENLVRMRTEKGLTQEELAKRTGVSQGAIWQYENKLATPKIAIALALAAVLGTTCEELMNGKEAKNEAAEADYHKAE